MVDQIIKTGDVKHGKGSKVTITRTRENYIITQNPESKFKVNLLEYQ